MKATRMIKTASLAGKIRTLYKETTPAEKFFAGTAAVGGIGGAIAEAKQSNSKPTVIATTSTRRVGKI